MRIGILILVLALPAVAAADLDGPGWDVPPSRYIVNPDLLEDQGPERGFLYSPSLSVLSGEGARPLGMDTHGETPAAGIGLRLSLNIPIILQLSVGSYVDVGYRGFFNDWEDEFAHFMVVDSGMLVRLRTAVRGILFFLGGHGGHTFFTALRGSNASNNTWHAGAHAGLRAGANRTSLELQAGFTARHWKGGDLQYQDHFKDTFVELYGSIGVCFLLGDYQ